MSSVVAQRATTGAPAAPRGRRGAWWAWLAAVVVAGPFGTEAPRAGLDPGWQLGLSLARLSGTDTVFTYGPWGWVDHPQPLSTGLVVGGVLMRVIGLSVFFWAVHDVVPRGRGLAVVVAGSLTVLLGSWAAPDWLLAVALSIALAHRVQVSGQIGTGLWVVACLLVAPLLLVKVSSGLLTLLVLGAALLVARQHRELVGSAVLVTVGLGGWWALAGRAPSDLPGWLRSVAGVVAGYPEAMSAGGFTAVGLTVPVLGSVALVSSGRVRGRGLRAWTLVVPTLVCMLVGARVTLVRNDSAHFALLVVLAVPLALVGSRRLDRWFVGQLTVAACVLTLGLVAAQQAPWSPGAWVDSARLALAADDRASGLAQARSSLRERYDVSAPVLSALEGHPVVMDPWELSLPWAYGLESRQLPVLQPYSAYTPALDELQAEVVTAAADARVVREMRAIDERRQVWDSPAYNLALFCHFLPTVADRRWTVFEPAADRCAEPEVVSTTGVAAGRPVLLPSLDRDQALVMRFAPVSPSAPRRLADLLLKPTSFLWVTVDGDRYRLPRALAGQPCLVAVPDGSPPWWDRAVPETDTVTFSQPGTVSFAAVTVADPAT